MLADELRDAYRRGVKEKKERFYQELPGMLLKCAEKGELPYLELFAHNLKYYGTSPQELAEWCRSQDVPFTADGASVVIRFDDGE